MKWFLIAWLVAIPILAILAAAYAIRHDDDPDDDLPVVEHKRDAWRDVQRFPTMSEPAAKGIRRDPSIGRDYVRRDEREKWMH